jgi:heat shock protein HtpX
VTCSAEAEGAAPTLVQLGISRSREYAADATGGEICGDPEALARALVKLQHAAQFVPAQAPSTATASLFIINPFGTMGSVARWFSTHPSTEERVWRLREMAYQIPRSSRRQRTELTVERWSEP